MAWAGRRFGKTLVIMLGMNLASIALIATPLLVNAMKDWYFFLRLQVIPMHTSVSYKLREFGLGVALALPRYSLQLG